MATRQDYSGSERQAEAPWSNPDIVDEASDESFPASDPPSWTPIQRSGAPIALTPSDRMLASPAPANAGVPEPFSPGEWAEITYENRQGAKTIVAIMVTIFLLGLAIYGSISMWIVLAT